MEPVTAVFRGTYDALYEACDILAISMTEEIAKLSAFKAKYDAAFVAAFLQKIADARAIEDEEQRVAKHSLLRVALVKHTNEDIQDALGDLRLYIRDAYANKEVREIKLSVAGFDDYAKAMNYNWEVLKSLMIKADTFITDNLADLTANNNMPVAFPATFTALKEAVATKVPEYLNERENTPQGTQEKIKASNELYEDAIAICEDGAHVFRNDAAKQKQFVWDDIIEIVTPAGKAGLKFDVKEDTVNTPIGGVTAKIQREGDPELSTVTDALGKGAFTNLKEGKYVGHLAHADYQQLPIEIEITTGVTSFKHYVMVKNP